MTRDTPTPGVVVHQPKRGFRYGSEAFWLASFALEGGVPKTALDLGTGSGIVAFLLTSRSIPTTGVDVRPEWATMWARSLAESTFQPKLLVQDVRDPLPRVDLVVSNPPYFPRDAGPIAPDPFRAAARTESTATIADFVRQGINALTPSGRMCLVVPRDREADVLSSASALGFGPHRLLRVGRVRILVELASGGTGPVDDLDESHPRVAAFTSSWR